MAGVGRICVNYKNGKPSYISVYDSTGPFDADTDVDTVIDEGNLLSWEPTLVDFTATTLKIRLKGKGKRSRRPPIRRKTKAKRRPLDDPDNPTSGTLVITLNDPNMEVEVQNAQYVEDTP